MNASFALQLGTPTPSPEHPPPQADAATRTRELIAQHRKVLHQLELQAARFGLYCPPHITIEIDETKQNIAQLERDLRAP
jgi:hypothetical protein